MGLRNNVLGLFLLAALGCGGWKERVKEDANKLGNVRINLNDASFGYLKNSLSPLELSLGACRRALANILYVNCTEATWGSTALITARFVVDSSIAGTSRLPDETKLYDILINSEFKGTRCGDPIQKIRQSKTACGHPISVTDPGTGRHDLLWKR